MKCTREGSGSRNILCVFNGSIQGGGGGITGIEYNKSKCMILYLGWSNAGRRYKSGEECLQSSPAERDLGLLVDSSLKRNQQCALTTKRANPIMGCITA